MAAVIPAAAAVLSLLDAATRAPEILDGLRRTVAALHRRGEMSDEQLADFEQRADGIERAAPHWRTDEQLETPGPTQ